MTPQESDVIGHINQQGSITTLEVERLLSVKVRRAREMLKDLAEKDVLEKRGSARSTFYVKTGHKVIRNRARRLHSRIFSVGDR